MPGIKELKNRIKSIGNMRKITRAMQMVSAAKMRKAQTAVLASRTYASLSWELILNLSAQTHSSNPLLASHPRAQKVGVVLLTSNTGLVGSLNTNLLAKLKEVDNGELLAELVVYGKKGRILATRLRKPITADFEKNDKGVTTSDIYPLAKFLTDSYNTGQYKKIVIIYNHFLSTIVQKPTVKQLLPFIETVTNFNEVSEEDKPEKEDDEELDSTYIFEPGPEAVLNHLLPRIIESQIYQTILESNASEHSARMVMMKNATEAAGDLIADLTLTYNQLRQNKITTELAEITAGKIALE